MKAGIGVPREELAAFLDSIPWQLLSQAYNRRRNAKRKIHAGGRPKVLKPCPKCGALLGARERAKHHC